MPAEMGGDESSPVTRTLTAATQSRRAAAGLLVLALLLIPAAASIPELRWNLNLWRRLHRSGSAAPDSNWDLYFRQLAPHLPARGSIGFLPGHADPIEASRLHYFLQYSLAPRHIVRNTEQDLLIVHGDALAGPGGAFTPVLTIDEALRLYRRIR